jgi:stalled ribosome alternative rescue factor ArfA
MPHTVMVQLLECMVAKVKKRNPIASTLRDGSLKTRIVKSKKGKGSYVRRTKNRCLQLGMGYSVEDVR